MMLIDYDFLAVMMVTMVTYRADGDEVDVGGDGGDEFDGENDGGDDDDDEEEEENNDDATAAIGDDRYIYRYIAYNCF